MADGSGFSVGDPTSSKSRPWPEVDLGLATADVLPAPPLPLNLFPGWWAAWIEGAAERGGCSPDYVACSLLAVIGATIGNARWGSPWEGWEHPPVVNVACIGLPSTGKSPGMDAVAKPLAEMAAELNEDWDNRRREHRTAKQEAKERRAIWEAEVKAAIKGGLVSPREPEAAAEPDPPQQRRAYSSDPTIEAARDLSAANPRGLLLYRDELAGWVEGMARYGNGKGGADRAFWLEAYGGGGWSSDRVKDGDAAVSISHLTWGILGGMQPDRLASVLLAGDDDGLAARFLYVWPAPRPGVSPRPTGNALPFDLRAALRPLRELLMPGDEPVVLRFTEHAAEAMQEWRRKVKQLEAGCSGLFLSWVGKMPGFAVRLAVVWAHIEWKTSAEAGPAPTQITIGHLAPALAFLIDYALPMAKRAFGEAALPEVERDARQLARWYLRLPEPRPTTLNARELRRIAHGPGLPTAERILAALGELAELGWFRPAPARDGDGFGRRRGDWAVNPKVHEAAV